MLLLVLVLVLDKKGSWWPKLPFWWCSDVSMTRVGNVIEGRSYRATGTGMP